MLDTMKKLDETGQRILFIAPEGKLKAVVTDGDIRKCILRGGALSAWMWTTAKRWISPL